LPSEITVSSSGSGEPALDLVAAAFKEATGHAVRVAYNQDLALCDVIVASRDAIDRKFRPAGRVEAGGVSLGRLGLGMGARSGGYRPDISTVDAFTRVVLGASAVLITDNHTSGLYFESVLGRLGIHDEAADRLVRLANAPAVMDRLVAGAGRELLFLSVNEIRTYRDRGVALLGPLPPEVQYVREFIAVPASASRNKEAAWAFVRFCDGAGRAILAANGFE
jgi:molybdate transport system substrate-binding protein